MKVNWKVVEAYLLGIMAASLFIKGGELIDAGDSNGWLLVFLTYLTASLTSLLALEKP